MTIEKERNAKIDATKFDFKKQILKAAKRANYY
jgi:hypothetical protein